MKIDLQSTAQRLLQAEDILILTHRRPDGDTIGSGFGLYYALKELGKKAVVKCIDPLPHKFSYFYEEFKDEDFTPQFIVTVDVASASLLGEHYNKLYGQRVDLAIDHHVSNDFYAKETHLDSTAPAAAEVVYWVIKEMGIPITKPMADALFTGLVTDTGGFHYASVTHRTFRVGGDLIEAGADNGDIFRSLFETQSRGRLGIVAYAIDHLEYYLNDQVALLYLPAEVKKSFDIDEEELDGISSLPRTIEGVNIGVTIRELGKEHYRISLRTHAPVNSSKICKQFGGGGHLNAAGCTIRGEIGQVKAQLLDVIKKELERTTA